jgi:hypothetical protein
VQALTLRGWVSGNLVKSDGIAWMNGSNQINYGSFRGGHGHQHDVDETTQLKNQTLIVYPNRFVLAAPVGGGHL